MSGIVIIIMILNKLKIVNKFVFYLLFIVYLNNKIKETMTPIFYNETALNGKYQVMSALDIENFLHKTSVDPNHIHEHKNVIFKNLHNYWVSKQQLEAIKLMDGATRTSF